MSVEFKNVRLGDVLDIRDGTHDTPKYVAHGIPLITSKNLTSDGLSFDVINFISNEDHEQISRRSKVDVGDILFGMIGTIGNPILVETLREFSIKNVALLKNSNVNIYPKYLLHYLKSPSMQKQIADATKGGTQKFVSLGVLRGLKANFPPLEEQKRIAAILDKADSLHRKRAQAIALADDFLRATFLEMFGDPVTNPKGWDRRTLAELTYDWRGGANLVPEDFCENGFPILHKGAIQKNGLISVDSGKKAFIDQSLANELARSKVRKGDVVVTLRDLVPTGPSIGLIADLSRQGVPEFILAQGAYGFSVKSDLMTNSFLVYLSNTPSFRRELAKYWVGSTQIHIRNPVFQSIEVPVPERSELTKFDFIVSKLAEEKQMLVHAHECTEQLVRSLSKSILV